MIAFLQELLAASTYQKLALLFSLIYIVLAVRNNPWCFVFGLVGAFFWALESYYNLHLKFDASLQLFYMLMSIWGLWQWLVDEQAKPREQTIRTMSLRQHILYIGLGILLTMILVGYVAPYINTQMPLLDAGTTVFSMIGTYLLVQRYLENWLYFIVVNGLYIYIYNQYDAHLFVIMMVIFLIMAILGYWKWLKLHKYPTI